MIQPETVSPRASHSRQPRRVRIPDSLKNPMQTATMRNVAARITPSLLAALEPVELSEELSRQLLAAESSAQLS